MGELFIRNVKTTSIFFAVSFVATIVISFCYILVAAFIQYEFVQFFGESTFNYIVGGLLSLFLGIFFCQTGGAIFFMFVKGWHVAALAYARKIEKTGASAFDVGLRAFKKNLVSFGAVYGVRALLKHVLGEFTHKLWSLCEDVPYGDLLRRFSTHPIVQYLAHDVLHYAFDATIFYLVKHPPDNLDDVPSTVVTALKKYLLVLPSILFSSAQTYILFRFIPKMLAFALVISLWLTRGLVAGILITVLLYPIFYILNNAFLDPLTMIVFITAYGKKCSIEIDENNPIIKAVDTILNGGTIEDVPNLAEDETEEDAEDNTEEEETKEQNKDTMPSLSKESKSKLLDGDEMDINSSSDSDILDIEDDEEVPSSLNKGVGPTTLSNMISMVRNNTQVKLDNDDLPDIEKPKDDDDEDDRYRPIFDDDDDDSGKYSPEVDSDNSFRTSKGLKDVFDLFANEDLEADLFADTENPISTDRAKNILSGGDGDD